MRALPPGADVLSDVTVMVYALSKFPVISACDVVVLPPTVQTESMVIVAPDRCTSRFEQVLWPGGPAFDCIARSVEASMHCRIVWLGVLRPSNSIFISHNPGLRDGSSAANAGA